MSRFPWMMRAIFALTLGLVLAGAGAAHRPVERPTEAAAQAAAMAAFLAVGGSLADLCHDAGDSVHGDGHGQRECPACVLQKTAIGGTAVAVPVPVAARRVVPWPVATCQGGTADPVILPPARGPPETTFS